ncbi:MAG: phage holin family protein [Candidatus Krumholzibacteria bacterium]|nr:phage holin family protein [Candidatus Krumholzibacteria bacterium]MDH4337797.1 phage holin family protein [Candidatus Krumholzibacteria bacterium]MDH5270851.1 phage holin family protein [Candidatus Krumholzibacteria bacterium]
MTLDNEPRARTGIFDKLKSQAAEVIGTSRNRIDTFSADVESRIFHFLTMLILRLVAFVCVALGLFFAMLTVIFGFDLPPRYALGIPAATFLLVGVTAVILVRVKKRKKPARK